VDINYIFTNQTASPKIIAQFVMNSLSFYFQCRKSQNFLRQICKIFITFGLKILRFLRLVDIFEIDVLKG